MAPSPEEPNQLQTTSNVPRTIEPKPATVSVTAASAVLRDIGDNTITERAEDIRYSTDEAMIWQESPSLALLVPRAVKYLIILAVIFIACAAVKQIVGSNPLLRATLEHSGIRTTASTRHARKGKSSRHATDDTTDETSSNTDSATPDASTDDSASQTPTSLDRVLFFVKAGFSALFALLLLGYLFKLKTTKYCASSQRLIVEEGSWHSVNRPYELHQLGDAVIMKPALLRLFNIANLVITKPHVELYGLRNAEYVRDILRQGGQLEAQRADKIRWR